MYHILLVEDDKNICEMICSYFNGEGYQIKPVFNGKDGVICFEQLNYDLILLDLILLDMRGIEVLRLLRTFSMIPVIILTAIDNDTDKAIGLHLGADDYVTKPFSFVELSARIRANIRRATAYNVLGRTIDTIIHICNLEIDVEKHFVKKDGIGLELTHTEFEILKLLASHPGKAFSKEELYLQIWKESYLEMKMCSMHI